VCGPVPFMTEAINGLLNHGVQAARIRWETFTAVKPEVASLTKRAASASAGDPTAGLATVEFRRSGKSAGWPREAVALQELAGANGMSVRSACRTGDCFTCAARVLTGHTTYSRQPEDLPDDGTVLVCSAIPDGDVVLDL